MQSFQNQSAQPNRSQLMSRAEAASYLGVTVQTLAIWACTGRYSLPYIKIGRLVKYSKSDLDAFIEKRRSDHR
jgi:excisionase family DNA binding protein